MILKASQRSGAAALADHLMNSLDNDHVELLETRGFMAEDLHGAFAEVYAISKATRCRQFLFSLSLNPPQDHVASEDQFLDAADRIEERLGLGGQPRAIVIHEKEGRRHAHVVWSRIDGAELKAINLPHFKNKLRDLSRDLFLDHGWELPKGLQSYGVKSPLNFTLKEWQQAKRTGIDPREIKQIFQSAWERSDSQTGFKNALEERGYFLAKGDRRGFVALDVDGNLYSIPKWTDLKSKEVRARFGDPGSLPSVAETRADLNRKVTHQMRGYIDEIKSRQTQAREPLRDEHRAMKAAHRAERKKLKEGQSNRWQEETKARSARLNKGLRGIFDRLTGAAQHTRRKNEREAYKCAKRDQAQRDRLVVAQMKERKKLQKRMQKLREKQIQDRHIMMRDLIASLRRLRNPDQLQRDRQRRRTRGLSR
ncbi:relaxase/mobilization nuclease domain-containing protein [Phaeobacter inhibens]|uniref:relaxase/mobilization nuclease domain-containing protein n=1 Tax=Phaeobacter inhibens TaxID=221822 RepID=UPI0021A65BCD|nr:relaxase/mobilization nuclease domain-containing protein [Phaeobacter inhibens]UWR87814.1 relaxase/mobilization nuclease domain-containing protein [Phaeobacter inhibens]